MASLINYLVRTGQDLRFEAMVNGVSSAILFLLSVVLFIIPATFSLEFNLTSITSADNSRINTTAEGSGAYISPTQGVQLTPDERNVALSLRVGRATYVEPLHLWDKDSGNLTDFTTHFTFVIDSRGNNDYADGLAFFLAPTTSTVGDSGGNLGLAHGNATLNNSAEPFFAVEFDTFPHPWDPIQLPQRPYTHVGIDINNMVSVNTTRWWNNISSGVQNEAWISYNGTSHNLAVTFTHFPPEGTRKGSLMYQVDLREFLPEWVMFGFSAATGASFQTNNVKSWDFNSSLELAVNNPQVPSPSPDGNKKNKTGLVIGLTVGLSCLILGLIISSYVLWKRSKRKRERNDFLEDFMDNEFEKGNGPKKFSYEVLARATNNFAEGEKLGEGGFGGVYKGFLREENVFIAVKKVSSGSKQGIKEYASEVKIISKLRHRNLVQLIGWCHERGGQLLLVYEFMPNGSLDSHLFKGNYSHHILDWGMRYKIVQGLAGALLYLHEEWEQCVVHRDVKSSNVMLDSSFNAKLGDFGLARLVDHEKGAQTTMLAGTMGYMAPECVITGRASKESDVYSFGIVALEIASGRRPTMLVANDNRIRTVEWVWEQYGRGNLLEAIDPKLNTEFDEEEMRRLMVVALWCAHPDSNFRPSIRQAIQVLNFQAEVPVLPPTMPIPTYLAPPATLSSLGLISTTDQLKSSTCTSNSDSSNFTSSSTSLLHSR